MEENGGSDTPTEKTDLIAWPSELKQLMTSTFNHEIPFVALASDFEYSISDELLTISDSSNTNFLSEYGDALVKDGFTKVSSSSDDYEAYRLDLSEDAYISVEFTFTEPMDFLGYEFPGGNEIYVTLNHVTSTWPTELVRSVYSNLSKVDVPSFAVTGKYEYYLANDGIVISGNVSSDISNDYLAELGENNFMTGEDYFGGQYYYDWEEYVTVNFQYVESVFAIQVTPMVRSYDEFVTSFPVDKIKTFLGEDKTEVPSIDIKYGDNIKYAYVEADKEYGTEAYIELTYKDDYAIIADQSMANSYKEVLTAAGWTIDDSYYEDYGSYMTTSANEDVILEFYSSCDIFVLDIALAGNTSGGSGSTDIDSPWNDEIKALLNEVLGEQIPYIELDEETLYAEKDTDDYGDMVYIEALGTTSFVSDYKAILTANGYVADGSDSSEGYTVYFYTKGDIVIEFAYVPADAEYDATNYILTYLA